MPTDHPACSAQDAPILNIGAGIAGLTLAHGLRQAGFRVAVFERDESPSGRDQGYRIHLDAEANTALRACLPAPVYARFLALSEPLSRTFTFLDERRRELAAFADPPIAAPDDGGRALDRLTLRRILLTDLDDAISFGKVCCGVATTQISATAHFTDDTAHTGAFLIGADGSGAAVARSLFGLAAPRDTGAVAVIGRVATTPHIRALLPRGRFDRLGIVLGPCGVNLFLSARHEAASETALLDADASLADYLGGTRDASVWSLFTRREKVLHERIDPRDGASLRARSLELTAGWHPGLRRLIALTEAEDISVTAIRSADTRAIWQTDPRATLVGDAAHTMAPLQGQGASVALRDAHDLVVLLTQHRDKPDRSAALAAYERRMRQRAYPIVRASKLTLDATLLGEPFRTIFKGGLRLADRVERMRQS